jgi:cell division protein FtsQ
VNKTLPRPPARPRPPTPPPRPPLQPGPSERAEDQPQADELLQRPRVDPRFRRRWAEARRAEGRRRLRVLLIGAGTVLAAGAVFGALNSPLFALRRVVLIGNLHTPRSQVLSAAGLRPGRTLMIDAVSARAVRAVDALPWVQSVSFVRRWPWTVVVRVHERVPAALVAVGVAARGAGRVDVIDRTGRVLEALPAQSAPALPVVTGAVGAVPGEDVRPAAPVGGSQLHELLQAAAATPRVLARDHLSFAYASGQGLVANWRPAGAKVVLGSASELRFKLEVLAELANRVNLSSYSLVDLTVPDRPALSPLGG